MKVLFRHTLQHTTLFSCDHLWQNKHALKKVSKKFVTNKTFPVSLLGNIRGMVNYIFDVREWKSSSGAGRSMLTTSWLVRMPCVTFFRRYSFFSTFFSSVWPILSKVLSWNFVFWCVNCICIKPYWWRSN